MSAATAPALLTELQHAHAIIKTMLGALTIQQKSKVHEQLAAAGVSGEGMTRANERLAVIEAATAQAQLASASGQVLGGGAIRQYAGDISAHAARLEILLLEVFDKLDGIKPQDQATRSAVDAVECFTTCAMRNGVLMREAADQIAALVVEGGAP
ncbi:hypothetical protein [Pseudoduganella namucuonensis]|uniref:Uncharacterized protein n=1 Tax=Pseudoduganella namucuonensis TaxID=1035707 RepID=A0A1I7K9C9_9BURK|nr:hypothetical protein [Pseudoduganella namucuonensis]SFU93992.1 hypothetical protein SAMN05216552_1015128 [Pseudoduganella namucuonensis]